MSLRQAARSGGAAVLLRRCPAVIAILALSSFLVWQTGPANAERNAAAPNPDRAASVAEPPRSSSAPDEAARARVNAAYGKLPISFEANRGKPTREWTAGAAYVTGYTQSTDFPTAAALQVTNHGAPDAFVTKLNPAGSGLVYSTYLGGSGEDLGRGIAVDAAGDAYVSGYTFSTDFPTTVGAFQRTLQGPADAFVTKLNPAGSGLVYSTYLGGGGFDGAFGIAVDAGGNAYVTGQTTSTDFPTTAGAFQPAIDVARDAFVTKLNPAGSGLVYSTYLGGSGFDDGYGIAVDAAGAAYVTGTTNSTNFPTTAGAFRRTNAGGNDAFVTKLNSAGSGLVYSTYLGGSAGEQANGIAIDAAGDAYVTGTTNSTNFPTTAGAFQTTNAGGSDGFVTKLNPAGSGLVYSTYLGGSGIDSGTGIAVDAAGNAYVTGLTLSTNFPTTAGTFQRIFAGGSDGFVTKLNPAGSGLLYSTYLGGSSTDMGNGIAVDAAGNAYVSGTTDSTNFPTTAAAFQTAFAGRGDAFVTKLALRPPPLCCGDFNGDKKADILWRNNISGQVFEMEMNGTSVIGEGSPGSPDDTWAIVGLGDFNGDGHTDILWRNRSGELFLWLMNGLTITGQGSPGAATLDWQIAGVGDFNGDGEADILWRNTNGEVYIWLMNGFTITGQGSPGAASLDWQIAGVGDFNGDGKADILWRNTNGEVYLWLMNGTTISTQGSPGTITNDWQIAGVGDFNGDGKADLLWRNANGDVYEMEMNGLSVIGGGDLGNITTDWQIAGVGDFNGDGKADILWRNTSGQVYELLMNGTKVIGLGSPGTITNDWQIQ